MSETYISTQPTKADLRQKRGNSASITFAHTFGAAASVNLAKFTIRDAVDGTQLLQLTKALHASQWDFSTSNVGIIKITPSDTSSIAAGDYFYDVQLTQTPAGTVTTFQEGRFFLSADITTSV